MSSAAANPLFELQQTLYASGNYTRRRLHRDRMRWVTEAIAAHSRNLPVRDAIEYGPGSGLYLPVLAAHCERVVGADVEPAYLQGIVGLTAALPGLRLLVDDIQDSALPDDAFGLVLCSEVLEHVPDPERSLNTLARILRPGGIAIVTTPQRFSTMELCCKVAFLPGVIDLVRLVYREPVLPTGHISLRTAGAFMAGIRAAGFEVVESARFGLYVPLLAEFAGDRGGRLIERLEHHVKGSPAQGLLWTQAYVLRKPAA